MSVLADTCVWVDHFRRGNEGLAALLDRGAALCHPHVIGELACGGIRRRREVLSLLLDLPAAPEAAFEEVLTLVDSHGLHGIGLGWVDVHLLASAKIAAVPLWTLNRRLAEAATRLGCNWRPS